MPVLHVSVNNIALLKNYVVCLKIGNSIQFSIFLLFENRRRLRIRTALKQALHFEKRFLFFFLIISLFKIIIKPHFLTNICLMKRIRKCLLVIITIMHPFASFDFQVQSKSLSELFECCIILNWIL